MPDVQDFGEPWVVWREVFPQAVPGYKPSKQSEAHIENRRGEKVTNSFHYDNDLDRAVDCVNALRGYDPAEARKMIVAMEILVAHGDDIFAENDVLDNFVVTVYNPSTDDFDKICTGEHAWDKIIIAARRLREGGAVIPELDKLD